jgi:hypothetical protein
LIIWRSQDSEWRRYVDRAVLGVLALLVAGTAWGLLRGGDGNDVEVNTLPAGFGLAPQETTTTERTVPAQYTIPDDPTTVPATTVAVTTAPTSSTTTTSVPATTIATTAPVTTVAPPVVTTAPPPPDTKGPSIGTLRTSPSKVYEAPCTPTVTLTVSITDSSGVASAEMLSKALQRRSGTNDWYTTTSMSDIAPAGGSITVPVQITARDTRGNRTSVGVQLVVYDCNQ